MKKSIYLLFFILPYTIQAQKILKGIVVDEKSKPLPSVSVFFSNTSSGTKTDESGNFQITIPSGKYDLIISSIGYATFSQSVSSNDSLSFLRVQMIPKVEEMETVMIEPWIKDGWEQYGKLFTDFFIGSTPQAKFCRIKNPDVIRFRYNKKTKILTASAQEPIIVENKNLGYILQYQMESFEYSYESQYLIYTGYPFFISMKGGKGQESRWEKNRALVYYGSTMHFMRSIYVNQLKEDGFEVRRLQWIPNTERERVKNLLRESYRSSNQGAANVSVSKDSSIYYEKIMKQPIHFEIIGKNILPGDSIAYAITDYKAGLYFPDLLLVIYTKKTVPDEYRQLYPENGKMMVSRITLVNGQPLEIEARGNYYDPAELLSYGYWAWSEKISTMLPLDYEPGK
jgi:hypothetical protein